LSHVAVKLVAFIPEDLKATSKLSTPTLVVLILGQSASSGGVQA
jgi:hypothetical protein